MAEASIESGITETGSIGTVTAPVIGTITLLIALLPIEALRTACKQETSPQIIILTSCLGGKEMFSLKMNEQTLSKQGDSSPSWHKSPLTPGGQRQLPVTGSQLAPFLHLQRNEQFLPKNPSAHAERLKNKTVDRQSLINGQH